MSEWKPIETAPKDGEMVLISDGVNVVAAAWDWSGKPTWRMGGMGIKLGDDWTNWMPLPEPPK